MNRPFSPPPPPPADTSSSTPAFFAEDDDDDEVDDRRSIDDAYSHSHDHTMDDDDHHHRRTSHDSQSSVSTTSLILENISRADTRRKAAGDMGDSADSADPADPADPADSADYDLETGPFLGGSSSSSSGSNHNNGAEDGGRDKSSQQKYTKMDAGLRRTVLIVTAVVAALWLGGLAIYVTQRSYLHGSSFEHDPQATASHGNLRKMTREQVDLGFFAPQRATIQWVAGPAGEDGLLLETSHNESQPFLTAKDVRSVSAAASADGTGAGVRIASRTLVKDAAFYYNGTRYVIATAVPSRNMAKVLLGVQRKSNWRHSSVASYFVMDVAAQTVEPLVPGEPEARIQLAQWSPTSEAVSFTRADDDNNLYVRAVPAEASLLARTPVQAITTDGGPELFYGVPDWVYEEEVLSGASAAWWSPDGKYLAFLRTNETGVPAYPVQYFIQRPSGADPAPGEENYPEVRQIKYPKAGAHNPVVDLQFYEVSSGDVFSVAVSGDFGDDDRLITTVLWAGPRKVLVKETNRISDVLRVVVVDVGTRTGQAVRTVDMGQLDGGWFEISTTTKYVPADAARGRPDDGYIDTVVYNDGDHLGYFTPPENPEPIMLTKGTSDSSSPGWEVVDGPAGVDLERNLVYFVATIAGPSQRHVYSVNLLDGSGLKPLLDGDNDKGSEAFYTASFSKGAGYVLLENRGPGIPWQKVMTTPALAAADGSKAFEHMLEDNSVLAERVRKHALPLNVYGTLDVEVEDGSGKTVKLNYLERRPPHFNPTKKYPVLFQQYSGPGSQQVQKKFAVDFQSYVAAALGYVVVTVDPRGTGFMGRQHRVVVRGQLGVHEAHDHIAAAAHWAARDYVDADRLALWGWSYGGFTTLKTLEQDAGRHFRYGIAVAPVTDWRFYDSIYTERYMGTPQRNAAGYDASAVRNASALAQNVRFLVMHGVADDNVHMQNSLALLDRLDIAGVSNYDVHVFPDSDHSIYFHNGHAIVYDKIENWLVNAFNGEWLKVGAAVPIDKRAV